MLRTHLPGWSIWLFHKQFLATFRRAKSALHRKTLSALRSFSAGDCIDRARHHFLAVYSAVWHDHEWSGIPPPRKITRSCCESRRQSFPPVSLFLIPGDQLSTRSRKNSWIIYVFFREPAVAVRDANASSFLPSLWMFNVGPQTELDPPSYSPPGVSICLSSLSWLARHGEAGPDVQR